jgi:hypothetical protein
LVSGANGTSAQVRPVLSSRPATESEYRDRLRQYLLLEELDKKDASV